VSVRAPARASPAPQEDEPGGEFDGRGEIGDRHAEGCVRADVLPCSGEIARSQADTVVVVTTVAERLTRVAEIKNESLPKRPRL
jgi:hypothetical protein